MSCVVCAFASRTLTLARSSWSSKSSCTGAGVGAGGGAATGGGAEGSGDEEEAVKSSLVSEEEDGVLCLSVAVRDP